MEVYTVKQTRLERLQRTSKLLAEQVLLQHKMKNLSNLCTGSAATQREPASTRSTGAGGWDRWHLSGLLKLDLSQVVAFKPRARSESRAWQAAHRHVQNKDWQCLGSRV